MKGKDKKFVPVMLTPFDWRLKIDFDALSRLIDFYLLAGAKGLFANCLSSEMYSITQDERMELTQYIVQYVKGRVPVVATGSFGLALRDQADSVKRMYGTGVDAVILITSHFASLADPDELLLQNIEQLFNLTGNIPLGLYECPAPYKRLVSPAVFKKLLDSKRLIYHKDTSIEFAKVKAKLQFVKDTKMEFYDAHTPNAMNSLEMGAKGMSCIAGNFYPEMLAWICRYATDPSKQQEVQWLQSELTRVDPLIHQGYPVSAKYFLQKRGLEMHSNSRAYALDLTPPQKQSLETLHQDFLGWCDRLKIDIAF